MDYITKIKLKNAQNDYDTYYPVTRASALILDEGIENIADQTAPYISSKGYDYNINELSVNKVKYNYVPLWTGNAQAATDGTFESNNPTIYTISSNYNFSQFNCYCFKMSNVQNFDVTIYGHKTFQLENDMEKFFIKGSGTEIMSIPMPQRTTIYNVCLRIVNDNQFQLNQTSYIDLHPKNLDAANDWAPGEGFNSLSYYWDCSLTGIYGVC